MDWNGGWRGSWDGGWQGDEGGAGPIYVYAELIVSGTGTATFSATVQNPASQLPPAGNVVYGKFRPAQAPALHWDDNEEEEALILCRAL